MAALAEKICERCNTAFYPAKGGKPARFCSAACRQAAWRDAHMGHTKVTCDWCGKVVQRPPSGVAHAYKNHFCSPTCKGKWMSENLRGEAHPRWLDETSFINTIRRKIATDRRWLEWAEAVRTKADGLCERCGQEGQQAHHIREVAELIALIIDPDNGEWLCKTCHVAHHSYRDTY